MGWSLGQNQWGEPVGYSVDAVCSEPGCSADIDRGLAYTCGGLGGHDGSWGCGRPFCGGHLFYTGSGRDALCGDCLEELDV